MFQFIRKLLRLPDDQPSEVLSEELIHSGSQECVGEDPDEYTTDAETVECAKNAPGDYQGQPDTKLTSDVGQALAGVLDPTKVTKRVNLSVEYEDGTSEILKVASGKYRAFVEKYDRSYIVHLDEVFLDTRGVQ